MLKHLKYRWYFGLMAAVFMFFEVSVDMLQPKMMAEIVDRGILGIGTGGLPDISLVTSVGIRMLLIVLFGAFCGVMSAVMTNVYGQTFGNNVRKHCFSRIMHFSFEQTDRFTTGSLITRVTRDITQVERLVMQLVRGWVRCLTFLVLGTLALMSMNTHFLVVISIAFPLLILEILFVLGRVNPLFGLLQSRLDRMNTVIQENVSGNRVVKAFVQESRENARFGKCNEDLAETQLRVLILLAGLRPVMNIILNLATVALIRLGAVQVQQGGMQPGEVMASVTYMSQILNGLMMLAMIFQTVSRGFASAKRLNEVLATEPVIRGGSFRGEGADIPAGIVNGEAAGSRAGSSVTLENVSFAYPGSPRTVLRNISLDIRPGETFAIIGATGCGKTTLVSLIDRFYDATEGTIRIDGRDVREYSLSYLRDLISFVPQKNELFSTTLRDNITIGRPDASEEEIRQAARDAQAEEFILQQPQGYDTPVAERGMSISGGQRQRIAISRALLRPSRVMIFDDATSALDLVTEKKLYDALREHFPGITRIIIAQRIATVRYADRIAVLEDGAVSACGTHEELMETSAVYRDICESQLGKGGAA